MRPSEGSKSKKRQKRRKEKKTKRQKEIKGTHKEKIELKEKTKEKRN